MLRGLHTDGATGGCATPCRQIADGTDHSDAQRYARKLGRPEPIQTEEPIERVGTRSRKRE